MFQCFRTMRKPLINLVALLRGYFSFNRSISGYSQWNKCIHFQKICGWARYNLFKFIRSTKITLAALLHFCSRKNASKMQNFQSFLPLKEPLVAVFNETHTLTFKKYVSKQVINVAKLWERHKLLWLHSFVFALE